MGAEPGSWRQDAFPCLRRFLLELEEELDKDIFLAGLGAVVLRHCPAFRRVYIPYVTNQMYQEQLMQKLM